VDRRTTLISPPDEAEELRSRIRRPLEPELELDEIEEEEDIEAISFEAPPAPVVSAAPPAAAPRVVAPPPAAAPRAVALPLPPHAAAPAKAPKAAAAITTAPVSVELTAVPGRADVAIPLELRLGNGTAQVMIHLSLTLNLNQD
jgi:hypothetical protein